MSAIATISLSHILDECDGPILFLSEDVEGSKYVCTFLEETEIGTKYLCTLVGPKKLADFLGRRVALRNLIDEAPPQNHFYIIANGAQESFEARAITLSAIRQGVLPRSEYVLPPYVSDSLLTLNRVSLEAALQTAESRDEPVVSTYTLANLLSILQDLIRSAYKKEISGISAAVRKALSAPIHYNTQAYAFEHGSFIVKLRSEETSDLLGTLQIEKGLRRVSAILASADQEASLMNALRSNKGHVVAAYKRLLSFLIEQEATIKLSWSSPSAGFPPKEFVISSHQAATICELLSRQGDLEVEEITLEGVLANVDTHPKLKWTLKHDDGTFYHGFVDPDSGITFEGLSALTTRYRFVCIEQTTCDAIGIEKRKLVLSSFSEIHSPGETVPSPLTPDPAPPST